MEKLDPSNTAGGSVKWCNHFGKWAVVKTVKIELLYDPVISLLAIYPRDRETYIHTKICSQMFMMHYSHYLRGGKNVSLS